MVSIVEILGKDKSTKDKEILAHRKYSLFFAMEYLIFYLEMGRHFLILRIMRKTGFLLKSINTPPGKEGLCRFAVLLIDDSVISCETAK